MSTASDTIELAGVRVPRFLYGTAWKEDDTQRLTELALEQGFRGIDTANQRRHYHEAAVGRGVAAALERRIVRRDELFLQTKFTFRPGQDNRLPYDPAAPVGEQVQQSFASSLEHLSVERLDSYVLHGPIRSAGLGPEDWAAWRAMEALQRSGQARLLGISNVSREQLELLCAEAEVQPCFVQNRCFAALGWDRAVREFCTARGIIYQGFSLLTANREALAHPALAEIARRHHWSAAQTVFRFALDLGMLPLTGTSDPRHMQQNLQVLDGPTLDEAEVRQLEGLLVR
jgi:diketogulonate reductase-like aldo/keto reductase